MIRYDDYRLDVKDTVLSLAVALLADYMIVYLFYQSIILCIVSFAFLVYVAERVLRRLRINSRKKELEREFEEMLGCIASALRTGYSLENSFSEARKELIIMYGKDALIISELNQMINGLRLNVTVTDLMNDFAKRSGIKDILSFSEILTIAKKTGGNLINIANHTADNLRDKREIESEINTIIAGKKLEFIIMCMMPFMMLIYLRICSPDYMSPMYHNIKGIAVMTICLLIYILSFVLALRILQFGDEDKPVKGVYSSKHPVKIPKKLYKQLVGYSFVNKVSDQLAGLYPGKSKKDLTRDFVNSLMVNMTAGVAAAIGLIIIGMATMPEKILYFLLLALVVMVFIPYMTFAKVDSKIKLRNDQLLLDYADFINRFMLLVGAGSSMNKAIERCVADYQAKKSITRGYYHYLYEELRFTTMEINRGVNEAAAYEALGRRIRLLPYMKMTTMLVHNLKKGNRYILEQLNMAAMDAYEKKRDNIKKLGEEAGSKLLMPMMLEFILVLVIIMFPALSQM